MTRFPLFRFLLPLILLLYTVTDAAANVTGIISGVQENPIAGALVTFTDEANPALSFSGYTNAGGRYDIAIAPLGVGDVLPAPFTLHQNHPNPFNPSTTITFTTVEPGYVTLSVYNLLGQRVRTLVSGTMPAGEHFFLWDGRDDTGTPSGAGVYLYRLAGGGRAEVKKMLLLDGGSASGWAAPVSAPQVLKPASVTWTVTITGDDIEYREMNGLEIADGGSYDFYVIYTVEVQNFHLVSIPGETFEMGEIWGDIANYLRAGVNYDADFGPAHLVTLSDFEMSAYEITNAQYAQFLNEALVAGEIEMIDGNPYGKDGEWDGKQYIDLDLGITDPRYTLCECFITFENGSFKVEASNWRHWPVVGVSWYGAKVFAAHYGLDLPTEAEWEYAAGGGTLEYLYATDDGMIDATKANYTIGHPVDVGSYPPNTLGLYDMSGNVEELCIDWMKSYTPNHQINPTGPLTGDGKVIRGGSYGNVVMYCLTIYRRGFPPDSFNRFIGFRVVRRP